MTAEIGAFLAAIALAASFAQAALGLTAGARGDARLAAAAAATAASAAVAIAGAFALLVVLFVQSDFSVAIVTANSHTAKPLLYKIAGAWGNHEGSMLLWCLVSAAFGAALARFRGDLSLGHWSRAIGMQGLVTGAVLVYTLVLSNPFARLAPAPFEGRSLNPLLQDPALALHPPMLYIGYVGLSVPFSLAIAALLDGRADQAWARALRPWTLAPWACLTIGIALGSYWAYYELGWGGWWFWDPVENASFMPWLAALALLHSAIVTERRGSLAGWTILLAITGFGFALLGTFLVRSGVLTSVHAFAVDPARGSAILVLLGLFLGGGFLLYGWRAPKLGEARGFALVSREGALVLNNLGLAVAAGTILLGTLYPLVVDALTGKLISVGPPFFDITFGPLMALLFVAMPFAPLLAWRKGSGKEAWSRLRWAALASLAAGALLLAFRRDAVWTAIGVAVGVWIVLGAFVYLWKRLDGGDLRRLAHVSAAAWALVLAHLGAGVFTLGAVLETGLRQEGAAQMSAGASTEFAGRRIALVSVESKQGPNYSADRAVFEVAEAGAVPRRAYAERRHYPASGTPTTEVALLPDWGGDLYIALGDPGRGEGPPVWSVRLYRNPFVHWIFLGAGLMALGGGLGLLALARRKREPIIAPAESLAS